MVWTKAMARKSDERRPREAARTGIVVRCPPGVNIPHRIPLEKYEYFNQVLQILLSGVTLVTSHLGNESPWKPTIAASCVANDEQKPINERSSQTIPLFHHGQPLKQQQTAWSTSEVEEEYIYQTIFEPCIVRKSIDQPKKLTVSKPCNKDLCGPISTEIKEAVRTLARIPKRRRGMSERCKRTRIRRLIRTPKPIHVGTKRTDLRPPNTSALLQALNSLNLDSCDSAIEYEPWIRRPTRPQRVPTGDPPHVRRRKGISF
ncbi:hypothetical protein QAD02_007672 [Eretmocerus hayati]|uniref:Uncharacterized protein n=1 Tax=Eretmocerus hayati TaxID=131215 RepID=A0ACC2N494_9HYME|nr:hypothetical protein QAD02_007672 [Eretmocerus hayati]